jgi:putative flippase GtrA
MALLIEGRRFLLVGAASMTAGLVLIYGLLFLGCGPATANFVGYAVAIPLSYIAHAWISFQHREIRLGSFSRYLIAVLLSYFSNLLVLIAVTRVFAVSGYVAQIPALGAYGMIFFLLNRLFVFPRRVPADATAAHGRTRTRS